MSEKDRDLLIHIANQMRETLILMDGLLLKPDGFVSAGHFDEFSDGRLTARHYRDESITVEFLIGGSVVFSTAKASDCRTDKETLNDLVGLTHTASRAYGKFSRMSDELRIKNHRGGHGHS